MDIPGKKAGIEPVRLGPESKFKPDNAIKRLNVLPNAAGESVSPLLPMTLSGLKIVSIFPQKNF